MLMLLHTPFADQDHSERLHHPGLPGQVDVADQVGGDDAGGVCGPQPGQGGPLRPRRLLLRQHLLLPLPQVRA